MAKKVLHKRPNKLTLVVTIAAVCIIAIMALALTLLGRGETIQPELHRSVFSIRGDIYSVGSSCYPTQINDSDYCIGHFSMPVTGEYTVDASYRFGQKTIEISSNPPRKETRPAIFIDTVYSITKVGE